jgi:hypothetical protein
MAFVRALLERLRHPGVQSRGPALTLSGHVDELLEREQQSHRRQSQREQPARQRELPKLQRRTRGTPEPEPPPGPGVVVEGEAGRRWVPRS